MIANSKRNHTLIVRIFLCVFLCLVFISIPLTYLVIKKEQELKGKIYPHVFIDDRDVGQKTKKEVLDMFSGRENLINNVKLFVTYHNQPIATYSAQSLNIKTNIGEMYDKAFLIGRTPHIPSKIYQQLLTLTGWETFRFVSQVQYDHNAVQDGVNQFEDSYNVAPKNALFTFENDRVSSFQKEENGNKILKKIYLKNVDSYIRSLKFKQQNYQITLTEQAVAPDVTLAQTNNYGIEELIGEGVSNYTHSIPGRIHNVILGAKKLNGILIPKGKVFSFNDSIGDISASTGYQPAYIIKEGKTVLGDGGGICQVSTTLFRAALSSGLPITERYAHAYRVSYYENDSKPGLDATVFAPSVDLKFENNTPAAILIQTSVEEDKMLLHFRLFGKKDGRNAELSTPTLYDVAPPPPDLYQDDPTLKRGVTKQVDFPAWGGKASFNYKVTKNNQVLFEKTFLSVYKPWQAVYLVGTQD